MMLEGCRVLVVEDNAVIAAEMAFILESAGCRVIGPFGRLAEATSVARLAVIDAALLDVDINGELVFPIAHILKERRIPFAFVTGGDTRPVNAAFPLHQIIAKPFRPEDLCTFLCAV